MSKRALKALFPPSITTRTNLIFTSSSPVYRIPLRSIFYFVKRFSTSFSSDNLQGLIDPEDPFSTETSKLASFSTEEFALLSHSLTDSGQQREEKIETGTCSDEARLIVNGIVSSDDGFGSKTHKFLRQYRQVLSETLVVQVLTLIHNPESGVKFFIWAGRQIGYAHTIPVYNALLDMLDSDADDRIDEQYLQEIKGEDKEVLKKLLNVLIQKCCRNGMWNVALEELGRLKDFGYRPTRLTYNALIKLFLRAEKLDTAHLVYIEMSDAGYKMDLATLGSFARSLCKSGKWREALALIEKEEFALDTMIYTNMIYGLCEASLFEEAMDFLNRMRASSCIPNVITYSILICGCLRKRRLGRCKVILNMMIAEGCFPAPKIFDSLVHAYCRARDYSYAYKVLKKRPKCGYQLGYVSCNILIGGICGNLELPSSDELELAERAYNEMIEAGIVLNKINVSNFARCLCNAGKFEKAYKIIYEMMTKGFIPDTSTYSKVIGYLCNFSKVEKAFLLFEEMKRNGIVADVYTYTILIDSFCKAGLIEQARNWFDEMVKNGCDPTVVTYTALIHAYLKSRKLSNADEIFEMMLSKGCLPNVVTYTALIDGHFKAGKSERACQIYTRMRGNTDIPDVDMYFRVPECEEPNVFTYGALVDGLCKAHKVKEAHDLLVSMEVEGCKPNHIIYDSLIDGFCKFGKLDEAQEIFAKMSSYGYNPNVFTYSSLIDRLFKDKRLDLVLKVLSKMLENSCAPNVVIYTEMIDGLCKVGKTDEAYKLMVLMEEKGCYPNVVTYTAMIDGFGKSGKVSKSLELLEQMCLKGCAPNYVTYTVLINHCCAAGLLDDAYKLLEDMKQTHWPRHMASYQKVIEGFSRDFITSLGLLDEISENDSTPFIPIYRVMIDNFIKAGKLDLALELYGDIAPFPLFSATERNIRVLLVESLCLANMVEKGFELYADMIHKGVVPELDMFFHLIKGLIKVNRWEEALQLSDSVCQMGVHWIQEEESSNTH